MGICKSCLSDQNDKDTQKGPKQQQQQQQQQQQHKEQQRRQQPSFVVLAPATPQRLTMGGPPAPVATASSPPIAMAARKPILTFPVHSPPPPIYAFPNPAMVSFPALTSHSYSAAPTEMHPTALFQPSFEANPTGLYYNPLLTPRAPIFGEQAFPLQPNPSSWNISAPYSYPFPGPENLNATAILQAAPEIIFHPQPSACPTTGFVNSKFNSVDYSLNGHTDMPKPTYGCLRPQPAFSVELHSTPLQNHQPFDPTPAPPPPPEHPPILWEDGGSTFQNIFLAHKGTPMDPQQCDVVPLRSQPYKRLIITSHSRSRAEILNDDPAIDAQRFHFEQEGPLTPRPSRSEAPQPVGSEGITHHRPSSSRLHQAPAPPSTWMTMDLGGGYMYPSTVVSMASGGP
jgi:hypothetical protein